MRAGTRRNGWLSGTAAGAGSYLHPPRAVRPHRAARGHRRPRAFGLLDVGRRRFERNARQSQRENFVVVTVVDCDPASDVGVISSHVEVVDAALIRTPGD